MDSLIDAMGDHPWIVGACVAGILAIGLLMTWLSTTPEYPDEE